MIELNPLDVLKSRKLDFIPPHFSKLRLGERDVFKSDIEDWIKSKLKGRYCIKNVPFIDNDDKLKSFTFVGFEDEKEMTFFMLGYPNLRR